MDLSNLVAIIGAWATLSVPVALVIGAFIGGASAMPSSTVVVDASFQLDEAA